MSKNLARSARNSQIELAKSAELRNTSVVKRIEPDGTREQVARVILEGGPTTTLELANKLEITPAGIRRHLDSLVVDGVLAARKPHQTSSKIRGRGRPSKVFAMTDLGREKFEHSYDDLAVAALKFMAAKGDATLVTLFAQSRAEDIERRALPKLLGKSSLKTKMDTLVAFLTKEGYAATVTSNEMGAEICQHHCPIAHVAAQFPELCEAETAAVSKLLGTHVQRLATIAHGDGVCTTFVPNNKNLQLIAKGEKS